MSPQINRQGDCDVATSIQLSPEIEQRLDFLASQTGCAKDFYVRELVERAVEEMEDYYLAADVLERIREGTEEVYSAEEVSNSLGLDDSVHEDGQISAPKA